MTENNILTCGNAVSQVPILPWNCQHFSSCFLHLSWHFMHSGRENAKKNVENSWKSDDNSSEKFPLA